MLSFRDEEAINLVSVLVSRQLNGFILKVLSGQTVHVHGDATLAILFFMTASINTSVMLLPWMGKSYNKHQSSCQSL